MSTKKSIIEILNQTNLFSGIPQDKIKYLEELATAVKIKPLKKNYIIISEGDDSDKLYIMISGKATAFHIDEDGRQLILNTFLPGDCFGELSAIDKEPRSATVITKEKSEIAEINSVDFLIFLGKNTEVLFRIIMLLSQKLRKATQQIEALVFKDSYNRLTRLLMEMQNDQGVIEEKMSHQELSEMIGCSRETVTRILKELVDGEFIRKENGLLCIRKTLPDKF